MSTGTKIGEAVPLLETTPLLGSKCDPPQPDHEVLDVEENALGPAPRGESFGYLLLLLSGCGFTVMGLFVRIATGYHGLPVSTVVFIRGLAQSVAAILIIAFFMDVKETFTMSRQTFFLLCVRGLFGGTAMSLVFLSLSLLPLGIQASLFFLNPIFTMILSSFVLGEAFGGLEIAAALLSFVGVLLVSNPTFQWNFAQGHSSTYVLGCAIALLAAVVVAFAYIALRAVSSRVNFMVSVLSLGFFVTIFGIAMGGSSIQAMKDHPYAIKLVLLGCVSGFGATCALNSAFRYCRAGTGTLMRNIDVPIAYVFGLVFLNEVPHVVSLFGAALVILGTVLVGTKKMFTK